MDISDPNKWRNIDKEFETKKERDKYVDTLYLDEYDAVVFVKTTRNVEE